jgi:hypothetical protein
VKKYRLNYVEGPMVKDPGNPFQRQGTSHIEEFDDESLALTRAKEILIDGRFYNVSMNADGRIISEPRLRQRVEGKTIVFWRAGQIGAMPQTGGTRPEFFDDIDDAWKAIAAANRLAVISILEPDGTSFFGRTLDEELEHRAPAVKSTA